MKISGSVFSGSGRGKGLLDKYHARLIGIVGFRPYYGTFNLKLDHNFDIKQVAQKTIEQVLKDGTRKITAYLSPVVLRAAEHRQMVRGFVVEGDETVTTYKWKGKDAFALLRHGRFVTWDIIRGEADRRLIESLKQANGKKSYFKYDLGHEKMNAWAITFQDKFEDQFTKDNVLEFISPESIRDKLLLRDDDIVEVEFV